MTAVKLDIGYRSQLTNRISNDCGAAVVAALGDTSIEAALDGSGQERGKPLHFKHMYQALRSLSISYDYHRMWSIYDIVEAIRAGKPSILLVGYRHVSLEMRHDKQFDGSHFVVAVGYDEENKLIFVHDPLWPGEAGAYRPWPEDVVIKAMSDPGWGNQPNQAILINRVYPFIEDMAPIVVTVEELEEDIDRLTLDLHALYHELGIDATEPGAQKAALAEIQQLRLRAAPFQPK